MLFLELNQKYKITNFREPLDDACSSVNKHKLRVRSSVKSTVTMPPIKSEVYPGLPKTYQMERIATIIKSFELIVKNSSRKSWIPLT